MSSTERRHDYVDGPLGRCGECGLLPGDSVHRVILSPEPQEAVDHPAHYGGADNPYEVIKVITAWELNFNTGNCVKYIARAGKKDSAKEVEDLKKAQFYLAYEIDLKTGVRNV